MEVHHELVDQLDAILAGPNPCFASQQLPSAGHTIERDPASGGHSSQLTWQNGRLDNGGGRCPEKSHIGSWDP